MKQIAVAPLLEVAFPDVVFDHKIPVFDKSAWKADGKWQIHTTIPWGGKIPEDQSMVSDKAGDSLTVSFTGTGITLMGNWVRDGGKADIYLDGKLKGTIDSYFFWGDQEHYNMNLWHIFGLDAGEHSLTGVVRGEKRPESAASRLYITEALVFRTESKKNKNFHFTFEN